MTNEVTGYIVIWEDEGVVNSMYTATLEIARKCADGYYKNVRIFEYPSMKEIPLQLEYEYLLIYPDGTIKLLDDVAVRGNRRAIPGKEFHRREVGTTQWFPLSGSEIEQLRGEVK